MYRTNADAHKRAHNHGLMGLQVVASRYAQGYMIHAWVMSSMISDGEREEEELIRMGELSQGRLHVWLFVPVAHLMAIIASSSIASIRPSILQIMFPPKDWSCLGRGR